MVHGSSMKQVQMLSRLVPCDVSHIKEPLAGVWQYGQAAGDCAEGPTGFAARQHQPRQAIGELSRAWARIPLVDPPGMLMAPVRLVQEALQTPPLVPCTLVGRGPALLAPATGGIDRDREACEPCGLAFIRLGVFPGHPPSG